MQFFDVSVPEVYKESADFRFFLKWFAEALTRIKYDTENTFDLYDPLRCPEKLVWMLADTMGFKYDSRLPTSFNRLVLLYFMSMIRNRGSIDGVTLAAETNLAQFTIQQAIDGYVDEYDVKHEGKEILSNRLENTSIPVNSVYVTPHTEDGYIDVVYFSTRIPIDACIEYVRPLGMYLFQSAGVRMDARTKVSVDARLTDMDYVGISLGPTHVGHYSRDDYARMQHAESQKLLSENGMTGYTIKPVYKWKEEHYMDDISGEPRVRKVIDSTTYQIIAPDGKTILKSNIPTKDAAASMIPNYNRTDKSDKRRDVWYRNSEYEGEPNPNIDPGYRAVYSLQLANNEQVVKALIDPIFSLGYGPQTVDTTYPDSYLKPPYQDKPVTNLRYDYQLEHDTDNDEAYTIDNEESGNILHPEPAVNPRYVSLGDAISMDADNSKYTKVVKDESPEGSHIELVDADDLKHE